MKVGENLYIRKPLQGKIYHLLEVISPLDIICSITKQKSIWSTTRGLAAYTCLRQFWESLKKVFGPKSLWAHMVKRVGFPQSLWAFRLCYLNSRKILQSAVVLQDGSNNIDGYDEYCVKHDIVKQYSALHSSDIVIRFAL